MQNRYKIFTTIVITTLILLALNTNMKKKQTIFQNNYTLITQPNSPYSESVKLFLDNNKIDYHTLCIVEHQDLTDFLHRLSLKNIPVLIKKNDENFIILGNKESIISHFDKKPILLPKSTSSFNIDLFKQKEDGCIIGKQCESGTIAR